MTVLPGVLKVWANARAGLKTLVKDDSGQAALVIITVVIVAAGVTISQTSVLNNRRSLDVSQEQRVNFQKITKAIDAYAAADIGSNGNGDFLLPCPADPADGDGAREPYDGAESTDCNDSGDRSRGIVPWADLGLSEQDVIDSNGNYLTYIVHSTDVEACDGEDSGTDSLNDLNGGLFAYALVAHGGNGAGAYNSSSNGEVNGGSASNFEAANCTTQDTCGGTADQFRSGPPNDTLGTEYFDDIVRAVTFDESFTGECPVINEDQGCECPPNDPTCVCPGGEGPGDAPDVAGGDNGTSDLFANRLAQRNANGGALNAASVDFIDEDGSAGSGDEIVAIRFINNDNFDTAACFNFEPTLPLDGYTIRAYAQVHFELDNSASDTGIGNGLVFGFAGHKYATSGGSGTAGDAVFIDNTTCGGTNSANGFGDDGTNAFDQGIERFGIELDTYDHRPDPGPPATETDIYDPNFNHVAIVLGNVNHEDADAHAEGEGTGIGTGSGDDGPICRSGTTTDGDPASFGTALADRGGVGTGTYADDKEVSSVTAGEACLYNDTDTTWLENGEPFANSLFNRANDVRIEVHGESTNACGAGQILVAAWVYEYTENCGNCDDVTQDFTDDDPHVSMCIDNNDLNAAADDESEDLAAVRLFLSNGFAANGLNIGGDIAVTNLIALADRVDGATKATAGDTDMTIDVTENVVRQYFYDSGIPTGNLTFDQSYVRINQATGGAQTDLFEDNFDDRFDTGISVFSTQGSLFSNLNDGLGVAGVGQSNSTLDTIDPSGGGDFNDFGEFLNVPDRERLTFEFDELYRRFTVNLRNFGEVNNAGYLGSETENVLIRAFNQGTQVGSDLNVDACTENANTTGDAGGMTINHDFGGLFDLIQIIPVPAEASDDEGHTRILVGAVKACGADLPCGFYPQGNDGLVSSGDEYDDASINNTEAECHQIVPWPVTSTGMGASSEVDPDRAGSFIGDTDNASYNTQRTWIDFNLYNVVETVDAEDSDAMDVNILSQAGNIHIQDNSNSAAAGFGVNGAFGSSARIDSDDDAAAGEEEELRFRFNEDWSQAMVRIGFFNDILGAGGGDLEQAVIALYNDDALVESHTVTACTGAIEADTNNNWRKEVLITPSANFDEIRVSANDTTTTATSSNIYVNAVRACDLVSGADCGGVSHGDSSVQPTRFCTETIN